MLSITPRAEGNIDVISLLEQSLEVAKEGKMISCAVAFFGIDGTTMRALCCVPGTEGGMFLALDRLKDHIKTAVAELEQRPIHDATLGADFVCWNLRDLPHNYDFLCGLVEAEMTRIREGAPAPLKICFHNQPREPNAYTSQFFNNVMMPAIAMMGAKIDGRALRGKAMIGHNVKKIVEASRAGEGVPRLQCDPHALAAAQAETAGCVTISLREAERWPHRNSNLPDWIKLAEVLKERGERVIFVRDTAMAHEPIEGFETHPMAAISLQTRLALYETAKCNLFVPNGPFGLALFGSRPFICFQNTAEHDPYEPLRPSWWKRNYGMTAGKDQFPWSYPNQRLVWERDDFPIMLEAWNDLEPEIS